DVHGATVSELLVLLDWRPAVLVSAIELVQLANAERALVHAVDLIDWDGHGSRLGGIAGWRYTLEQAHLRREHRVEGNVVSRQVHLPRYVSRHHERLTSIPRRDAGGF